MSHDVALLGIAVRPHSRAPMVELEEAAVTRERGVAEDSRGAPGHRQVTVLSLADWEAACGELGRDAAWTTRRANLLVTGVSLQGQTGGQLRIGDAVLRITGELEPCSRMEEQVPGLEKALTPGWRGGVTCEVVASGVVRKGDPVELEAAAS